MKTLALVVLLSALPALAQGPLQPPTSPNPAIGPAAPLSRTGSPLPTMKTLHQVEPRFPLTSDSPGVTVAAGGGITITARGSYYLTRDVEVAFGNGIVIDTDEAVTIDLNGFTISSTANPASGCGIYGDKSGSIIIRNGHIHGTGRLSGTPVTFGGGGFIRGIQLSSAQVSVFNIQVCGTESDGIFLSSDKPTVVADSSVRHCGNVGITAANIRNCIVTETSRVGIAGSTVTQCEATSLNNTGIVARVVSECRGTTHREGGAFYAIDAIIVSNSEGLGVGSARSIRATIATSCVTVGPATITHKYNMP